MKKREETSARLWEVTDPLNPNSTVRVFARTYDDACHKIGDTPKTVTQIYPNKWLVRTAPFVNDEFTYKQGAAA